MNGETLRCPSIWSLNWFLSRTVRQATQMCKHVRKLVNAQRDLLSPKSIPAIAEAMAAVHRAMDTKSNRSTLPTCFIRFFPAFCFSSSLRLRVMSPP